jgi:hypothetical protein
MLFTWLQALCPLMIFTLFDAGSLAGWCCLRRCLLGYLATWWWWVVAGKWKCMMRGIEWCFKWFLTFLTSVDVYSMSGLVRLGKVCGGAFWKQSYTWHKILFWWVAGKFESGSGWVWRGASCGALSDFWPFWRQWAASRALVRWGKVWGGTFWRPSYTGHKIYFDGLWWVSGMVWRGASCGVLSDFWPFWRQWESIVLWGGWWDSRKFAVALFEWIIYLAQNIILMGWWVAGKCEGVMRGIMWCFKRFLTFLTSVGCD